jgi:hypothetical protein
MCLYEFILVDGATFMKKFKRGAQAIKVLGLVHSTLAILRLVITRYLIYRWYDHVSQIYNVHKCCFAYNAGPLLRGC